MNGQQNLRPIAVMIASGTLIICCLIALIYWDFRREQRRLQREQVMELERRIDRMDEALEDYARREQTQPGQ